MAPDEPDDAPGGAYPRAGSRFGDYLIGPEIGRGAMGVVFEATDQRLGRRVALKLLPPEASAHLDHAHRFDSEVSVLLGLGSPHIVRVLDHGEIEGRRYLAMQRIEGPDLGQILRTDGPLPVADALRLAGQLADGLADAHRAGVLHRDVKPSNVLVGLSGGEPFGYLCDFGIAKAEGDRRALTVSGSLLGTLGYLAPERARGEPATRASDVYSFGCLLWAMLVGRAPYSGGDTAVLLAHQQQPVPRLAGDHAPTVAALNRLLARALAKDPADRYPGIEELRTELNAVALGQTGAGAAGRTVYADDGTATDVLPLTRAGDPPTPDRGRRVVLVAALAGLVVVGAVVASAVAVGRGSGGDGGDGGGPDSPTTLGVTGGATGAASSAPSAPDPLDVGFAQVNQGCTGEFLVVLVDVAHGAPADVVRNALDRFPDASDRHYLQTSASCENLASIDGKSRLTALPYLGPYPDARSACRERFAHTDASTYVIRLDRSAERGVYCVCAFEPADLPDLDPERDAVAVGERKTWGIGLQNLMGSVGHRIESPHTGDYDDATESAVRGFQTDQGLPASGAMDEATWAALQGEVCAGR